MLAEFLGFRGHVVWASFAFEDFGLWGFGAWHRRKKRLALPLAHFLGSRSGLKAYIGLLLS